MIHYVEGDILLSNAGAIAHGVAPFDHFSNGLALSLREQFPIMVKDFRHHCQQSGPKPGEAWMWGGVGQGAASRCIVSLLTQEPSQSASGMPGKAKLTHVNHALKALVRIIESEKLKSVALPRLATGVGGLDWAEVKPLIESHLGGLSVPVYVYVTFRKGVAATEGA